VTQHVNPLLSAEAKTNTGRQGKANDVVCLLALQHFSESIQEYLANLDKAPDPTVRKDTFSNEIFSAYEVLFNSWLQHREAKVQMLGGGGHGGTGGLLA